MKYLMVYLTKAWEFIKVYITLYVLGVLGRLLKLKLSGDAIRFQPSHAPYSWDELVAVLSQPHFYKVMLIFPLVILVVDYLLLQRKLFCFFASLPKWWRSASSDTNTLSE